jgi:hypothetical protein
VIAIASQLNGAVTVRELLSSSALLHAAMRVLERGAPESAGSVTEDEAVRLMLLSRAETAGG